MRVQLRVQPAMQPPFTQEEVTIAKIEAAAAREPVI